MRASPAASKRRRVPSRFRRAEGRGVVALAAAVGAGLVGEGGVDEGVGLRAARGGVAEGPRDVAGAAEGGDAVAGGEQRREEEAADGAGGAGEQDVHQGSGRIGERCVVVEGVPEGDQRGEAVGLGVGGLPGLLVLVVDDAGEVPVPELGEVEPDVLQQVVVDGQALPVGEEGFEEGLVGALPEGAGGVEAGEHGGEGRGGRAGGEDAGVEAAEVGEGLVDVGGGGELGVVEEAVDGFEDDGVGVEEDDALVGELPEAELGEVVERGVEGGLLALGEGGAGVLLAAASGRR